MREGFRVGLIKKIDYGIRNEKFEETVRNHPNLKVIVSWHGDLCTVTVPKPDCMKDIGNGMWMLPQPPESTDWLYMQIEGPLFVRKCVRDICEQVVFPRLLRHTNKKRVCMITGTPGIGKSVLTNWVIAMIRSYFEDKDIYLYDALNDLRYEIQRDGSCFDITKEYYDDAVMHNPNAIVLVDTGGEQNIPSFKHAGFAMVTASPAALPKEMEKETNSSWAYLSVWDVEDILAAYFCLNPDDKFGSKEQADASYAEMKRRYAFAGGVPRILFGESGLVKKYEGAVDPAIERALSNFKNEVELKYNVHKVFHINPKDILDEYKTGFATIEIKMRFNEALKVADFEKANSFMCAFVDMNFNFSALQSTAGVFFEVVVNRILAFSFYEKEKAIEWKYSEPKNVVDIGELIANHGHWIFNADDIDFYREGFLYIPKNSNQPVIDSWTRKGNVFYFFQITKQKRRVLSEMQSDFFWNIVNKRNDIEIRLIFVVPTLITEFKITRGEEFTVDVSIGVLKVDMKEAKVNPSVLDQVVEYIIVDEDETVQAQESTELIPRRVLNRR